MASDAAGNTPTRFFPLSKLRALRETEQVAAVCYRVRDGQIEFLLVQTRGGRWTFPKGGVEPGLSHAQAAAMEAFEEAGVHGRIQDEPLTTYFRRMGKSGSRRGVGVSAHLCEVRRMTRPQERGRNRTWFSILRTKQQLCEDRKAADGKELARVVDRAVELIRENWQPPAAPSAVPSSSWTGDPLQKVQFEAGEIVGRGQMPPASYARYIRRVESTTLIAVAVSSAAASRVDDMAKPAALPSSGRGLPIPFPASTSRRLLTARKSKSGGSRAGGTQESPYILAPR